MSDMSGGKLEKLTEGVSIFGLFIMGALVARWTNIDVSVVVSSITKADGTKVVTTVQTILDSLLPGLIPLILTFICMSLLKNKISVSLIIFGIFVIGIVGYWAGILA